MLDNPYINSDSREIVRHRTVPGNVPLRIMVASVACGECTRNKLVNQELQQRRGKQTTIPSSKYGPQKRTNSTWADIFEMLLRVSRKQLISSKAALFVTTWTPKK